MREREIARAAVQQNILHSLAVNKTRTEMRWGGCGSSRHNISLNMNEIYLYSCPIGLIFRMWDKLGSGRRQNRSAGVTANMRNYAMLGVYVFQAKTGRHSKFGDYWIK